MVSAKTSGQIRDNLMPIMRDVCAEAGVGFKYVFSRKVIEVGDNEYIIMDGLDRSSATRLQGITLAGALIDEAALMPSDSWMRP